MVQTKEDNSCVQEPMIQNKMLNEAIEESTGVIRGEVCIIFNFHICLLSVFFYM
jgi:hypothetical protein